MFVSLYSRCDSNSCIAKNLTPLRIVETGVSITVLVVGILITLQAGYPLGGYIVMGVGGAWVVGNVIIVAIQYTAGSVTIPTSKQKKGSSTESEPLSTQNKTSSSRVTQGQAGKSNKSTVTSTRSTSVNKSARDSGGEDLAAQKARVIEMRDDAQKMVLHVWPSTMPTDERHYTSINKGLDGQIENLEAIETEEARKGREALEARTDAMRDYLFGPLTGKGTDSTSNRRGTATAGGRVESEGEEEDDELSVDSQEETEQVNLNQEDPSLVKALVEKIQEAKTSIEKTLRGWLYKGYKLPKNAPVCNLLNWLQAVKNDQYTETLTQKICADFDRIMRMPLTIQEKHDLFEKMFATYQFSLGLDYGCAPCKYAFERVYSNFNMALQVLVHTQLGDYFLYRPLEVQGQTTLAPKWQIELQALVRSLVDKMRQGKEAPNKKELDRLQQLKKELTLVAGINAVDDSNWLLEQFGVELKKCTQKELDAHILDQEADPEEGIFVCSWNMVLMLASGKYEILMKTRQPNYYENGRIDGALIGCSILSGRITKFVVHSSPAVYIPISNSLKSLAAFK